VILGAAGDSRARHVTWLTDSFYEPTGYSDEARSFLEAFDAAGVRVSARMLASPRLRIELDATTRLLVEAALARSPSSPRIAVHHYVPGTQVFGNLAGAWNVARTMFETDRAPLEWIPLLRKFDRVWVPSTHNRWIFEAGGLKTEKVRVLPPTIDFERFRPVREPPRPLRFLCAMRFTERKGWRELLAAWRNAFSSSDDVELMLLITSIGFDPATVRARLEKGLRATGGRAWRRRIAPVSVEIDPRLAPSALARRYQQAHVYVSASRGEAWGRPLMEALGTGLPTIAPRFGGVLDFMREEDCWLVDGEMAPVPRDAELQPEYADLYSGHHWFVVDVDSLATALRDVANDYPAARRAALAARRRVEAAFSPTLVASQMLALVEELL
jgi:glycosyltransferase involved in cell wall biosynthesis